ncbi:Wadjet anti-phage system protein JetD domain-containing protein [Accumulibacter sp.]|uniref:Wadjet anti-phage system protein JetD domain-containing protein n=1 Tax=Accumulibacter sp. TaxID=2053492 RepID=UPI00257FB103|nr:Wadjet anti-phage system protein JetD domain-containing protein [Accumulibacter sp.]
MAVALPHPLLGDIDTHGFAFLDQLRSHFGHVESFAMGRATPLAFIPPLARRPMCLSTSTAASLRSFSRLMARELRRFTKTMHPTRSRSTKSTPVVTKNGNATAIAR